MARAKRYSPEQIVQKLRTHEKLQAEGLTVPQACKRIGVSDQTFYRWRTKYGQIRRTRPIGSRPWRPDQGSSGSSPSRASTSGCSRS